MKQKLTLLILALFTTMGVWAFDVTVINSSESETTYGSLSSGTFTTNETSGLSGVTVSGVTLLKNTSFAYGSSLGFENVTNGTITLSAPEGYTILGYSLFAKSNTWSVSYTLTPAAGGSAVTTSTSGVTLVASGVNSRTTTIAYSASSQNHFYIPSLVISIKSDAAENVNVVYKEVYDGAVKRTNDPVSQVVGEAPSLPSGLQTAGCTYKYYTTEACTGEELSTLTSSTTEVYAKATFTAFTFSSGFDGATWYYVYFNRAAGKRYWQMDPNTTPYPDKSSKPSVSEALWAFTGNPYDGIKVMNARAGDGYYLKKTGTSSGAAITMQEGGDTWAIGTGDGGFTLKQDGTDIFVHDYSTQLAVWNSGSAANDKGSAIVVEAASPVKVTYKLTYNGNVISSYTKDLYELVGATATAPFDWVLPPYCSLGSCSPATIEAETTEVTVPLNWNGPFKISSDYASAVWYYMNIGTKWAVRNSSDDQFTAADTRLEAIEAGDDALWAYIGTPMEFKVYNKGAGDTKKVQVGNSLNMTTSDVYTPITITQVSATTFLLDNEDFYMGYQGGFKPVQPGGTETKIYVMSEYCGKIIDDVNTWAASNHLDEYFGIDPTCLTTIENMFATTMPNMDEVTYNSITIPNDITPYLVTKYPAAGFYRIKNNSTGRYIGYGQPTATGLSKNAGLIVMPAANAATDASSIIYLNGSAGTYKLSTQGLYVQSQTTANQAFPATTSAPGVDFVFTHDNFSGIASITNADSRVDDNKDGSFHNPSDGWIMPGVVNWSASNPNSKWVIEEATTFTVPLNGPVDGSYYATLCVPFDVTLDGATAYTLDLNATETALTMTEVEGTVAAGTPVLLKGTSASATASISNPSSTAISTETALTGTYVAKTVAGSTDYFLGMANGKVGFYHWDGSTLSANRAYLEASKLNNSGVKGFALDFEDDATGINEELRMKNEESSIYNLAGQRMNKMQKGINIINGKKILK